ncbi:MAG: hypothetical protein LBI42_15655 [Chitinispirillales bacterium]|jgi:hypothetical protein|nr:hypothetical protein [Chitinispirillales bacterium]
MDIFTEENLRTLVDVHESAVSIFMPTYYKGGGLQENPLRFKNLVFDAEKQLIAMGFRSTDAADFLKPARRLYESSVFWKEMSEGLAVFVSASNIHTFKLPQRFSPLTVVSNRFHLRPVLTLLYGDTGFFVLTLNIKGPRFFKCSRYSVERIGADSLPGSMDDTLDLDTREKGVQFSGKPGISGSNSSIVFGYGRQTDKKKNDLFNYFHRINDAVVKLLGPSNAPLITAGIESHNPVYREVNTYHNLLPECIQSNLEDASQAQIHSITWPIVEPYFQETARKAYALFERLNGEKSVLAVVDLQTIVAGAVNGRISTLFLTESNVHKWGRFDADNQSIDLREKPLPGDEDLLEYTAINTLFKGGSIYLIDPEQLPENAHATAILRF